METSSTAPLSQDGGPLALPGVIDPGLDFVVGLVLAISSGIYTSIQTDRRLPHLFAQSPLLRIDRTLCRAGLCPQEKGFRRKGKGKKDRRVGVESE